MTELIINPAQQVHGKEEIRAAVEVLEGGHWAEGKKAVEFRLALSQYLDVKHVVLTNSGSSANLAAIMALTTEWIPIEQRVGTGTEIITPALCFPTTVAPIRYAGATPVFVDVDRTWGIDVDQVREAIDPNRTRAIVVAHNLGNPFNLDGIMEIAKTYNLWVISDNCDALGSEWNGKKTGSIGHIGTSSFYPAHHISTGEGGAVYTNHAILKRAITSMVNWGRDCWCSPANDDTCKNRYGQQLGGLPFGYDHKNTYAELGFNLKMTDIQAALGVEQMRRLDGFVKDRIFNHGFLLSLFGDYSDWFELPTIYPQAKPSWFGYVIKLNDKAPFKRDEMVVYLEERGIRSRAFFCGNITRQPALWKKDYMYRVVGDLSRSDDIMRSAFWIGVHPGIQEEHRQYMKSVIVEFLDKY